MPICPENPFARTLFFFFFLPGLAPHRHSNSHSTMFTFATLVRVHSKLMTIEKQCVTPTKGADFFYPRSFSRRHRSRMLLILSTVNESRENATSLPPHLSGYSVCGLARQNRLLLLHSQFNIEGGERPCEVDYLYYDCYFRRG